MNLTTPVVLIIFNRPDVTNLVFEAIRKTKPQKLFVIADGPRFPEEAKKCQEARAIIDQVDWECQVFKNFSECNMGCKRRVSSGLDWVFSEVEEAIILEDDCLPAQSFFPFCQTLLEFYRHDERIMMISGTNVQDNLSRTSYSYYFSKYNYIWGWASWRTTWELYDVEMKSWPECKQLDVLKSVCDDPYEYTFWTNIFDQVFEGNIDTWDYQFIYACWTQNGLTAIPNVNLVSNIGFGQNATHTKCHSPYANLPTQDLWHITHPPFVYRNREADMYTFDHLLNGKSMRNPENPQYIAIQTCFARILKTLSQGKLNMPKCM